MSESKTMVAYWLLPAEPARTFFRLKIRELAARFDAPVFEPHLTLHAAANDEEVAADVLRRGTRNCLPIRLVVRDLQYSDQFTKTLFVRFEPNEQLLQLNDNFRRELAARKALPLDSHLSLIYKTMSTAVKRMLANSITFPFSEVLFDSAKAIVCPKRIWSRQDVESWRTIAEQSLHHD